MEAIGFPVDEFALLAVTTQSGQKEKTIGEDSDGESEIWYAAQESNLEPCD